MSLKNALLKLKSVRNTRLLWTNIYVIFISHLWIAMLYEYVIWKVLLSLKFVLGFICIYILISNFQF